MLSLYINCQHFCYKWNLLVCSLIIISKYICMVQNDIYMAPHFWIILPVKHILVYIQAQWFPTASLSHNFWCSNMLLAFPLGLKFNINLMYLNVMKSFHFTSVVTSCKCSTFKFSPKLLGQNSFCQSEIQNGCIVSVVNCILQISGWTKCQLM